VTEAPDPGARRPPRLRSDAQLVAGARTGCPESRAEIARRYGAQLRCACARVAGPDAADDAVQEALVKALAALAAGASPANLRAWLHRIARNAAIDELRGRRTWEPLDPQIDGVPQPPQIAAERAQLRDLLDGVAALPERQRRALRMRVVDERSYDEIGAALGTEEGAVRALLHRARSRLREAAAVVVLPFWRIARHGPLAHAGAGTGAGVKTGLVIGALATAGAAGVVLHTGAATPATARERAVVAVVGQPIAQPATSSAAAAGRRRLVVRARPHAVARVSAHAHAHARAHAASATGTATRQRAAAPAPAAPVARTIPAARPHNPQPSPRTPATSPATAAPAVTPTRPAPAPTPVAPPAAPPAAPEPPAPVAPPAPRPPDPAGTPAPAARGRISAWTPDAPGDAEGLLAVQSDANPAIARRVTAATDLRCYRVAGGLALSLGACPADALVAGTPVASAEMQAADAGASWRLVYLIVPA